MLNSTQRSSMLITKNTFEIRCKNSDPIKLFFYDGVTLAEQALTFTPIDSAFKVAIADSETEGHYFIVAGRNFQALRKGYSSIKMFFYDNKHRDSLVLNPSSYDNDGVYIGVNDYSYIGSGIYVVEPVVQTPSIVEIFGKIYYSFIYGPEVQTFTTCGPSTPIGLDIASRKFTIKVNDGEDPDMDIDNYDPVLTIK